MISFASEVQKLHDYWCKQNFCLKSQRGGGKMKGFTSAPLVNHDSGRPSLLYRPAQWIGLAVKESNMIRINAHYFYQLATNLKPLAAIESGKDIVEVYSELNDAEEALKFFLWN